MMIRVKVKKYQTYKVKIDYVYDLLLFRLLGKS